MKDYYYLLSSLPDLSWGKEKYNLDPDAAILTIRENLEGRDLKLFHYLLYPNDNRNLISAIAQKRKLRSPFGYFYQPAVFPEEVITSYSRNQDQLPDYMKKFLEDLEGNRSGDSIRSLEKLLFDLFYQEVRATGDDFLQRYFEFEKTLRKIVTAINGRKYSFPVAEELWGEDELNQKLTRGSASDFGLSEEYTFIPALLDASDNKDPLVSERLYDQLLWEYVDELVKFSFFNTHKVLGYTVHLLMVYRWMHLSEEEGQEKLNTMVQEIMQQINLPELN
jgi:hypothetical protein